MSDQASPIDALSSPLASSYAIGPIDSAQLITLPPSNHEDISLLVPANLPHFVLNDPIFNDGYQWGYFADAQEDCSFLQMVNRIYFELYSELWGEYAPSECTWAVGFLLGKLASLAETERTLALVGIAHLCFLLSCAPPDVWSCTPYERVRHMDASHTNAMRAYRARVRLCREQGMSFQEAQRLALADPFTINTAQNSSGLS